MTAVEYRGKIVVLDCGVEFPRDEMLGIDLVIPDIRWLLERRDDVLAFSSRTATRTTRGRCPSCSSSSTSPSTAAASPWPSSSRSSTSTGFSRSSSSTRSAIPPAFRLGPVRRLASSPPATASPTRCPSCSARELGAVVLTGDYSFDHTPIDGRITDVNAFAQHRPEGRPCPSRRFDERRDPGIDGFGEPRSARPSTRSSPRPRAA